MARAIAAGDRPALQIPIEIVVPPGFWARDPSHGRLPRTAMLRSVVNEGSAFAPSSRRFGVLVEFVGTEIGGWTYMGIQPVGAPAARPGPAPKAPPGWLVTLMLRLHPEGRRRLRAAREAYRTDAAGAVLKDWREVRAPAYRREILRYQASIWGVSTTGTSPPNSIGARTSFAAPR